MTDWIVTVPKHISWKSYQRELDAVRDFSQTMAFRVPHNPKRVEEGDRMFVTWDGHVRGWMKVVGTVTYKNTFICSTTGKEWEPGHYILRSGPFHYAYPAAVKGFRGYREYRDYRNCNHEPPNRCKSSAECIQREYTEKWANGDDAT